MSINYIKTIIILLFINYIQTDNNNTSIESIETDNIITDLDLISLNNKNITKNNKNNSIDKNNNISNVSNVSLNIIVNLNNNSVVSSEPNKNMNITVYDKNKILEIITNSKENNTKLNDNIIDDDINKMDDIKNIIIQNTHEDQLAESLFYFLCFILIIFIILFLYKFYKCYCQNTIKEFGEEGTTISNPNNDPELQRISTHDDDNIIDVTEN